jgi:hypothetical protein
MKASLKHKTCAVGMAVSAKLREWLGVRTEVTFLLGGGGAKLCKNCLESDHLED